jgi:hypothetical protein
VPESHILVNYKPARTAWIVYYQQSTGQAEMVAVVRHYTKGLHMNSWTSQQGHAWVAGYADHKMVNSHTKEHVWVTAGNTDAY